MFNAIKFNATKTRAILVGICCAMASSGAFANADVEFDFSATGMGTMSGTDGAMQYHLDGSQTGTGVGLNITGWQARANNRNFRNRTNKLEVAGSQGIGLDQRESGAEESMDNAGRYDLVIFEFDQLVSLDEVGLGWVGADYDMTVLAHTGDGDPTLDNGTFRYQEGRATSMTSQGWELIGHYAEDISTNVAVNVNAVVSSFWAIGAYTSAIVDVSRTYGSPDGGDDYLRLRSLAATVIDGGVAAIGEPPVTALLLLGLLLVAWRRGPVSGAASR